MSLLDGTPTPRPSPRGAPVVEKFFRPRVGIPSPEVLLPGGSCRGTESAAAEGAAAPKLFGPHRGKERTPARGSPSWKSSGVVLVAERRAAVLFAAGPVAAAVPVAAERSRARLVVPSAAMLRRGSVPTTSQAEGPAASEQNGSSSTRVEGPPRMNNTGTTCSEQLFGTGSEEPQIRYPIRATGGIELLPRD